MIILKNLTKIFNPQSFHKVYFIFTDLWQNFSQNGKNKANVLSISKV